MDDPAGDGAGAIAVEANERLQVDGRPGEAVTPSAFVGVTPADVQATPLARLLSAPEGAELLEWGSNEYLLWVLGGGVRLKRARPQRGMTGDGVNFVEGNGGRADVG